MKALVTGFDPFGGDEVNPSSLAVGKLKKRIAGIAVHTAELPTSYAKSAGVLRAAIDKVRPDIVLCVGQAGGRSELCLERRSEEHTSELQSRQYIVCRLLLE